MPDIRAKNATCCDMRCPQMTEERDPYEEGTYIVVGWRCRLGDRPLDYDPDADSPLRTRRCIHALN